jgi:hypothetical protein
MATLYDEPHAQIRMRQRGATEADVQQALWTRRERHEPHATREGSFWAPIEGSRNLWVLYRPLDGDDFVITVAPRAGK